MLVYFCRLMEVTLCCLSLILNVHLPFNIVNADVLNSFNVLVGALFM
jgi:hypothetical protein